MQQYDLVGIGIGPSNLSLASLLSKISSIRSCFFDKASSFKWHSGMLLPDSTIQVSHLYDLVTLVDPTNTYSFLSYLSAHKRLYRFANSNFTRIMRDEFSDYYAWVCRQLSNLYFNEHITAIDYGENKFIINSTHQSVQANNIVLGVGLKPFIPEYAKPYLGKNIYHTSDYLHRHHHWKNKRVMIVGGGQSGAEVFHEIISNNCNLPDEVTWISRRNSFLPMDESPFAYEIYTPPHTESFYKQHQAQKQILLQDHLLSSDGISSEMLNKIYQRLYVLDYLTKSNKKIKLLPRHSLESISDDGNQVLIRNTHTNQWTIENYDIIIFCTGYKWQLPDFISSFKDKIKFDHDGRFIINEDFSLNWDGDKSNRIYVQNAARHTHGVPDSNLCLTAWRSAKIINSLSGNEIYAIENEETAVNWDLIFNSKYEDYRYASNNC